MPCNCLDHTHIWQIAVYTEIKFSQYIDRYLPDKEGTTIQSGYVRAGNVFGLQFNIIQQLLKTLEIRCQLLRFHSDILRKQIWFCKIEILITYNTEIIIFHLPFPSSQLTG